MNKKQKAQQKKLPRRTVWIASAIAAAILILTVVGIIFAVKGSKFDYRTSNLGRYVKLSPEQYRDMHLTVNLDGVTDTDVEERILATLVAHRSEKPLHDVEIANGVMKLGDSAFLHYRGYIVDENGIQHDISTASNLFGISNGKVTASDPYELVLGSRSFISGFETGLIGLNPADYSPYSVLTDGETVQEGDVLFVSFTTLVAGEEVKTVTRERIVYTPENRDAIAAKYGVEFYDLLGTLTCGAVPTPEATATLPDGTKAEYYSLKLEAIMRDALNPITVDAYFPADYREPSLRGMAVKFDVYVSHFIRYDTPTLNDAFILETLGMTEEELAGYPGDTTVERYRAFVRAELEREYRDNYDNALSDAIISHLLEVAEIKRVPEAAVTPIYQEYILDLQSQYASYKSYMTAQGSTPGNIDDFAAAYYSIPSGTSYTDFFYSRAVSVAQEKLVFFYVAQYERTIPDDNTLAELAEQVIDELFEYYLAQNPKELDRDQFDTEEAYQEALASYRANMIYYYGEDYFTESAIYRYTMDHLAEYATVEIIGRS